MGIPKGKYHVGDTVYILKGERIVKEVIMGTFYGRYYNDIDCQTELKWHYAVFDTTQLKGISSSSFVEEEKLFSSKEEVVDDLLERTKS